jgi:hypothetical protein
VRQELWIPGPLPGQNEMIELAKGATGGGYRYAQVKKQWTGSIALLAKVAKLKPVERAKFRFEWCERNKARNPDNIAAGKKMVLDGLVTARILKNDGWEQVAGWEDVFLVSAAPGVRVVIESY